MCINYFYFTPIPIYRNRRVQYLDEGPVQLRYNRAIHALHIHLDEHKMYDDLFNFDFSASSVISKLISRIFKCCSSPYLGIQ